MVCIHATDVLITMGRSWWRRGSILIAPLLYVLLLILCIGRRKEKREKRERRKGREKEKEKKKIGKNFKPKKLWGEK
jgi:hypothetical protein